MLYRIGALLLLGPTCVWAADPKVCQETADFYETNKYAVGHIKINSPFDFLFFVRHALNQIKDQLPLKENGPFTKEDFDASFTQVDAAANADGAFGNPVTKFVKVVDELTHDCMGKTKMVNITYRVYSTDPVLAAPKTPEDRQANVEQPLTSTAQKNTNSSYTFRPLIGYDATRRGYGGGTLKNSIPGGIFNSFELTGTGSSSSRFLDAELDGSKNPKHSWVKQVDYHLAYSYSEEPASDLQLARGILNLRASVESRPMDTKLGRFVFRYGASIEEGNQQDGHPAMAIPTDTLASSRYGALRFYMGLNHSTRYSSTVLSYGVVRGGAGLDDLSFTKQVGDITFRRRFPGGSHRPLDVEARATAGAILTSKPMLLNERFFGGNSASAFIPGDTWLIPDGPLVRSIASNRLTGDGFGGTSFYSGNITVGKVLFRSPLIPTNVNKDPGFGQGLDAAEKTAENFFADDYETSSSEFKKAVADNAGKLTAGLKSVQQLTGEIRAQGQLSTELTATLREIDGFARRSLSTIGHSITPDSNGQVHSLDIKVLLNPSTSLVIKLIADLEKAGPLAPAAFSSRLREAQSSLQGMLASLGSSLDAIHNGPVGMAARSRAKQDMVRPREATDTLRNEVNTFSIGLVGLFDAGRLWPDKNGTRYAIGGGVRFSVVNVNFTLGVAVNPQPKQELGQGSSALFVQLSYTNLFR